MLRFVPLVLIFCFQLIAQNPYVGNVVCETCHRNIVKRFAQTAMARTSGKDFLGSGTHGRTQFHARDGFLFEDSKPLSEACLFCHASQWKPIKGTFNRYASPPFQQPGVGCERCHGPGGQHANGAARMVVPRALDAAPRDAICNQCHLSGVIRVARSGRSAFDFRSGDLFTKYVATFVSASGPPKSHAESLNLSRCKQKAGEELSCATCHDPHSGETDRKACSQCHADQKCKRGPDCVSCHMTKLKSSIAFHRVSTDHSIPRRPGASLPQVSDWKLKPATKEDGGNRELGLAHAELGMRTNNQQQLAEAERILRTLPSRDPKVSAWLGYFAESKGDIHQAMRLYQSSMTQPPYPWTMEHLAKLLEKGGQTSAAKALRSKMKLALGIEAIR